MKILILNGSPRNQGLISQMLDIMTEEARIRGAEVEVIPIRKLQVHPCTGCMACRSRQTCVLPEDDAQHTLQKIQWADRADRWLTLLLGKYERTYESSVRPHRVRHDGRKSERAPSSVA